MSVPAFKNSRSKVRRRRSHHALKPLQLQKDAKTGAYTLPHIQDEVVAAPAAPKVKKVVEAPKEEKKSE